MTHFSSMTQVTVLGRRCPFPMVKSFGIYSFFCWNIDEIAELSAIL
jgi:hypothetical protein